MMRLRESSGSWKRSSRFFERKQSYFFRTREGLEVGPFDSEHSAKQGLELFIYVVNECSTTGEYAMRVASEQFGLSACQKADIKRETAIPFLWP